MSISRGINNWCENKMEEILNNPNEKHPYVKAFGIGVIEGVVDNAIVWYPIMTAAAYYWKKQALKK